MEIRGTKADGLAHLPKSWTPRYVTLGSELAQAIAGRPRRRTAAGITRRLEASSIAKQLDRLFKSAPDGLLVRSSAANEEISSRGLYRSRIVTYPTYTTVAEAALDIWSHAEKLDSSSGPIPVLVQHQVVPQLWGHLSNEARLRSDRRDWLVEMQSPLGAAVTSGLRALRRDRVPLGQVELACRSPTALRNVLRSIAGALTRPGKRIHVEWLWDGDRVWVVQYDTVRELSARKPPVASSSASRLPQTLVFRPLSVNDTDLPKARCVAEYMRYHLPHADLLVLRDRDAIGGLGIGEPGPALLSDLEALGAAGAVIRTDTRRENDFEVMLDRTDTEFSAAQLARFLIEATKRLRDSGVPASDIAFIAHPFIPAGAAAWSLAAPGSPEVRIDATYGLPDGLLYYTHDSYIVNVRRRSVQPHVRHKDRILLPDTEGRWRTAPARCAVGLAALSQR
jgi:hypothetical protein